MTHYPYIYQHRAADYHRLITAEDADGNLLPALQRVAVLRGKRIVDLGTGTGRLPLLLQNLAPQIIGIDLHSGMLQEQQRRQRKAQKNDLLLQGDIRRLPLPNACADVVTAGWAIGHFPSWFGSDWRRQVNRVLQEMRRAAIPGGALIIIETLTTGSLAPAPPTEKLAAYYACLENDWGFTRQEIQTNYRFKSAEAAAAQCEFFFGPALAAAILKNNWATVPEWTGVWSSS